MFQRVIDLDRLYSRLEESIGLEWLSGPSQFDHPMKRAWMVMRGQKSPALRPSNDIPRVAAFLDGINQLGKFPIRYGNGSTAANSDFRDQLLLRAQISTSDFDAAETEAIVARAHSIVFRLPIVALEPRNIPTADFEIALPDQILNVECKARTSEPPLHRRILEARGEIVRRLWPLVEAAPTNYCVAVTMVTLPARNAIQSLVRGLRPLLKFGDPFMSTIAGFNVSASIPLGVDEEVVSRERQPLVDDPHVPEPVRSFMLEHGVGSRTTYVKVAHRNEMRETGRVFYRNPRVLVVHVAIVPDHAKATAECVRSARPQLSPFLPGIVAVRAPDFYGREQFCELGKALGKVTRDTARVSAIQVWHQAIEYVGEGPQQHAWNIKWQLVWIFNRRARYPIADGFVDKYIRSGEDVEVLRKM